MFNRYIRSIDEFRNNRLNLRRVSVTADLIKSRATHKECRFDDMREADLLLHYLTQLHADRFDWFPRTSVYSGRGSGVELFERLVSQRHFEKVKPLLGVGTVEELKALVEACMARNNNERVNHSSLWDYNILPIENVLNPLTLATTG